MVVRSSNASWAACRAGIEGETGAGLAEHLGGAVDQPAIPQGVREVERLALGGATAMWAALKRAMSLRCRFDDASRHRAGLL